MILGQLRIGARSTTYAALSHTMLEHRSDLVLTKKVAPPYIYSTTRLGQQLYFRRNLDQKGGGVDGR